MIPFQPMLPKRKLWSNPEFHDMWDRGCFEGKSLILLDGEILEMPAPNAPHDMGLTLADYTLKSIFGAGYVVRVQMGIDLRQSTEPIPDIAVVLGAPRDYIRHPTTALLLVEVSDSSLEFDRTVKASLFASSGIQDYWIINLVDRQLEVLRNPTPDATQRFGYRYADVVVLGPSDTVTPVVLPGKSVRVSDLLP